MHCSLATKLPLYAKNNEKYRFSKFLSWNRKTNLFEAPWNYGRITYLSMYLFYSIKLFFWFYPAVQSTLCESYVWSLLAIKCFNCVWIVLCEANKHIRPVFHDEKNRTSKYLVTATWFFISSHYFDLEISFVYHVCEKFNYRREHIGILNAFFKNWIALPGWARLSKQIYSIYFSASVSKKGRLPYHSWTESWTGSNSYWANWSRWTVLWYFFTFAKRKDYLFNGGS